jgi:hypothetical protein
LRKPRAARPQAEDEVVVLGPASVLIAAGALERLAPDDERRVRQRALDEHVSSRCLGGRERVDPVGVAPGALGRPREVLDAAAAGVKALVLDRAHLELEAPRKRDVVAVHARQELAAGVRARALRRGDKPARG